MNRRFQLSFYTTAAIGTKKQTRMDSLASFRHLKAALKEILNHEIRDRVKNGCSLDWLYRYLHRIVVGEFESEIETFYLNNL